MKNYFFTLVLLHITLAGIAQNLGYEVRSIGKRPIVKEKLQEVKLLSDFSQGYPNSWIGEYVSVMVSATCNGKMMEALSNNDTLSPIQMSLLKNADLGTNVVVEARYYPTNTLKSEDNIKLMNFALTVVPAIEAQYLGGYEVLKQYLKENAIVKISEDVAKEIEPTIVRFTINEEGLATDARVSTPSKDDKIDKILLEVIQKMPKWQPATTGSGVKVRQEFEFVFGYGC